MTTVLNTQEVFTPPVPSATVLVLRDGVQGLEVLLVKRHSKSNVLGGMHVFPGGKLDPADRGVQPEQLDQAPQALVQALGEADLDEATACGLHVAALRETLEECGLFLHGRHDSGLPAHMRQRLQAGESFLTATAALGLTLQTQLVRPWSRWITPRKPTMMDRRFDTRFFVALAPTDHDAEHDAHEVTEAVWLRPETALRQYWAGHMGLVPAQIISLMQLVPHTRASEVMREAQTRPPIQVLPEPLDIDGERVLCYPGDPQHPVQTPVWPGPTRLTWRNQRFEPEGGLGALLAAQR
jgi:8-oxo-dGTP pyrophosphatase MutT (NUDIX family)